MFNFDWRKEGVILYLQSVDAPILIILTLNYHLRLESLCKSDSAKVRLKLGGGAGAGGASFSLNSSLLPGHTFNCHLELALDSSKLGKYFYNHDQHHFYLYFSQFLACLQFQ